MEACEFLSYFEEISDPRVDRTKRHKLIDVVVIGVLSFIGGAQSFVEIEDFGKEKESWLRHFLELPNGIPSHDTFARVFARLIPEEFQQCFISFTKALWHSSEGDIIPIDGKTLRHSFDHSSGQSPLHLVSAWSCKNKLLLGQMKVEGKSNEIAIVPKIIELIDIKGCTVTLDAMGCQRAIAEKIIAHKGDYVLAVKANQGGLYGSLQQLFSNAENKKYEAMVFDQEEVVEGDHGRIEQRKYTVLPLMYQFPYKKLWKGLRSFIKVETIIEKNDKKKHYQRYYISSLTPNAEKIGEAIRKHWSIENELHWSLDVTFNEDDCRIRKGNAPENVALLRRLALSLLKSETTFKGGIRRKQRKALINNDYLLQVLYKI